MERVSEVIKRSELSIGAAAIGGEIGIQEMGRCNDEGKLLLAAAMICQVAQSSNMSSRRVIRIVKAITKRMRP